MSDELDQELRDQQWRRLAPGITDEEIDALDGLYDAKGTATGYGPAMMLTAYRLGIARGRRLVEAGAGPEVCRKCGTAECLEDARSGWYDDEPEAGAPAAAQAPS